MKKILSALVLIVGGILGLNKVNAEPFLSGINYLKALKIEGTSINFSANTLDYDLVVPYRQEKLVVNYTKGHSKQMVDVLGGPNLYIGVNSIVIRVTAEDKTVRNYNLIIRRQNDGIEVANNQAEILNAMKNNRDSHFYLRLDENEKAIILSKEIVRCLKENNKTFHIDWVDFKGITVRSLEIIGSNITDIDKEINPNLNFEITNKKIVKLIKKQRYFGINAIDTELREVKKKFNKPETKKNTRFTLR